MILASLRYTQRCTTNKQPTLTFANTLCLACLSHCRCSSFSRALSKLISGADMVQLLLYCCSLLYVLLHTTHWCRPAFSELRQEMFVRDETYICLHSTADFFLSFYINQKGTGQGQTKIDWKKNPTCRQISLSILCNDKPLIVDIKSLYNRT